MMATPTLASFLLSSESSLSLACICFMYSWRSLVCCLATDLRTWCSRSWGEESCFRCHSNKIQQPISHIQSLYASRYFVFCTALHTFMGISSPSLLTESMSAYSGKPTRYKPQKRESSGRDLFPLQFKRQASKLLSLPVVHCPS